MKKIAKKLCSITLALSILVSTVFVLPMSALTTNDSSVSNQTTGIFANLYNTDSASSPVKSISVEPITMKETEGYTVSTSNGAYTFFNWYSSWYNDVDVTVEFVDGDIITAKLYESISYNGENYTFNCTNGQNESNAWVAGETYQETISFMDKSTTVDITVEKASPYESIEIVSVKSIREDHYMFIGPGGNKFYMFPDIEYKVNFADGSYYTAVIKDKSMSGPVTGELDERYATDAMRYKADLSYSVYYNQDDEPWTVGGENPISVRIGDTYFDISAIIYEKRDWEYIQKEDGIYITGCNLTESEITIPEQIDGMPVVGIMSMNYLNNATIINVPDSVKYISSDGFYGKWKLEKINIGKGLEDIDPDAFSYCGNLTEINISEQNPYLTSINGVVYNKDATILLVYPSGQGDKFFVPDHVLNADVLFDKLYYSNLDIDFSENSKVFKRIDNVIYSADITKIFKCGYDKEGDYDMPDTVTTLHEYAFNNCLLSSITVSENVTEIVYGAFMYSYNLKNVELPEGLKSIGDRAFVDCSELEKVVIPSSVTDIGEDVFLWCPNVTIYGYANSCAYEYAKEYEIPFVELQMQNKPGDVNGDRNINNKDLGLLMQYLNNWNVEIIDEAADVNADDAINNKDYGLLMQYLNNWDVVLGKK